MAHGTLVNLSRSSFVRTPPKLAARIVRCLLSFPPQEEAVNILDPTVGEGDLLFPCWDIPNARLFGIEISADRAREARSKLPSATIVTAAFEGVTTPQGSMSLVLVNPPYFLQDGKRAEYRIIVDAGELLMPGGIMIAIVPARAAWDGTMVNHWCKWYEQVRVWKFPDRVSEDDESAFEDYTQICVVGIRLPSPRVPEAVHKKRLSGFRWRKPEKAGQSPWEQGLPPPELPETAIADPYPVPAARIVPTLVVRNADEATLLYALSRSGAHFSPAWQAATTWPEEGLLGSSAMPYTGEAHVAAEFLTGVLDGEIVSGPGSGPDATPHLFTSFVGQEWVSMQIDAEEREKLRERGVVHVSMRQTQDKPILGVLDLEQGTSRYLQGDEVFAFLQPWLHTLAARVVEKRIPRYQLNPEDWEIRVVSQFGTDKQLSGAAFPGLAPAQQHQVYAMGRSIDLTGRTAIQGEPGTGKTRLAAATAARMAYRWCRRTSEFRQTVQPAWIAGLRRAWLKNPAALALLGLEPVRDPRTRQVVAYQSQETGQLLAPEAAGPSSLPVLVSTPLKVTKEYAREIRAAWPEAEVLFIEKHTDIVRWLERCATSAAPAVFAICSHSTTRAFGREWQPAVLERAYTSVVPDLEPDEARKASLEAVYDQKDRLVGYRSKDLGDLLTKEVKVSHFYCPTCSVSPRYPPGGQVGRIDAVPGQRDQAGGQGQGTREGQDQEQSRQSEPVTSLTWFRQKPRWCTCPTDRRNEERRSVGKPVLRAPLWQERRLAATERKNPQLSFAAWSQAMTSLVDAAREKEATGGVASLVKLAQSHESVLVNLVETIVRDRPGLSHLLGTLATCGGASCVSMFETMQRDEQALAQILVRVVKRDDPALADLLAELEQRDGHELEALLVELAKRDTRTLASLVDVVRCDVDSVSSLLEVVKQNEAALVQRLLATVKRHPPALERLVEAIQHQTEWFLLLFGAMFEQAHHATPSTTARAHKEGKRTLPRGVRLVATEGGQISTVESDLSAAHGYEPVEDGQGSVVAYRLSQGGPELIPVSSRSSRRVVGYASSHTGQLVTRTSSYGFRLPPADSFSPYQYLYRFFRGCVALSVVDESHNGRGRDTDIAHAHHLAMLSAQARALTSGTHYGGDILGFYHYWYRFDPQFWTRRGYGWKDAEKALSTYGVIQEWTKEYETDARRGSGKTTVQVSTIPAPGLSAKLIPSLLEDLCYLAVLDVGAYMPPRIEIPEIVPMRDPEVEQALEEAAHAVREAEQALADLRKHRQQVLLHSENDGVSRKETLAAYDQQERSAIEQLQAARTHEEEVKAWALPRHIGHHYLSLVRRLDKLAQERNQAARMAKGTVPRWFAALPCERPFEVWQTERSDWGDTLGKQLIVRTPALAWEHLYPMEKRLIEIVQRELAEGRRCMVYMEQNDLRSMARRLEWVLKEFHPWTLPNSVEAEDRQQAIIDAVASGHQVIIVPYRRVNEGLNLQEAVDTIIWYEMAMNLFMLDQASRRAWRLGKREEVRIYYLVYAGTAGHAKLRKLGGQSGAAAAFAGEPARGALIEHAGADKTTLARLSASLETELEEDEPFDPMTLTQADDAEALKEAFAKRGEELREALRRGRQWFGAVDTLPERLAAIIAEKVPSVWAHDPVEVEPTQARIVEAVPEAERMPLEEPALPVPAMTMAEMAPAPTAALPIEVEPTIPAYRPDGELAPTQNGHGRNPTLVFGLADHILLARRRRSQPRTTLPHQKNRTEVLSIPATSEIGEPQDTSSSGVMLLSLWELTPHTNEDAAVIVLPVPATPLQRPLWAE
jgi:predicted RNA methylase